MSISSNWKLTILRASSSIVFVDYDDELMDEPEIGGVIGLNIQPIPYGVPVFELTKADYYEFQVTKINYAETDALARQAMVEAMIDTYMTLGIQPLRLEIRGLATRRYDFAEAAFSRPRVRRLENFGGVGQAAWSLSHTITAKQWNKTIIP